MEKKGDAMKEKDYGRALKKWKIFVVIWPLLCIVFAGIILYQSVVYQSVQGMEERAFDAGFTVIPLIFFGIGMAMRSRLLKECRYATTSTSAIVVSTGKQHIVSDGNKRAYFPEYEFQVGETIYHVKSKRGYSQCFVSKGTTVELYYAPENPELFYVPIMQKHDRRWSFLLCTVGILWPFIGLFAPQLRAVFSFIEHHS